jgi:hypothetical protein
MNATKLLWSLCPLVSLTVAFATPALAQPKKGDTKTTDSKSSDASKSDASKSDSKTDSASSTGGDTKADPQSDAKKSGGNVEPPHEEWDIKNVDEAEGRSYLFTGIRYRGAIIPKFMLNMFVDEGKTIYTNTIGLELDIRKDGFSLIPALSYAELGTGDILFKEKGTKELAGNYNLINSSLKVIYATADLLWSTKINKNLEFEYGAGFGLGVVFGDLITNWVKYDNTPTAPLRNDAGQGFTKCTVVEPAGTGCNKADHQNSSHDKVNDYVEPSWFGGGSRPALFPWIAVPQIGLRFKPIKQFVGRLGLGFSLTGFWFGLSGQYGLEQPPKP